MAELAEKIYGDALFQSALEENKLDEVKAQLDILVAVFQKETAFLSMMDSPAMDAGDKQKILQETFDGTVEEILYNFLRILCDKRRMGLFLPIADCLQRFTGSIWVCWKWRPLRRCLCLRIRSNGYGKSCPGLLESRFCYRTTWTLPSLAVSF